MAGAGRSTCVGIAVGLAFHAAVEAQLPPATVGSAVGPHARSAARWAVPRTAWGHPDLQGFWNNGTATTLERPADLADKEFLTDAEWAARAQEAATRAERRPDDPTADLTLAYNNVWWDRGAPLRRTSLIIDPPNGKLPALSAEGLTLMKEREAAARMRGPADSWEDRPLPERCLLYHAVPPLPTGYNNNYLIAQTPQQVTIRYEMLAETRTIWVDGRPHLGSGIPQWTGNSRGRWEGDTLVVDTVNYSSKTHLRFFPVDYKTLRITERFTRTSLNTIDYRFTVDNPTMYTRPWTASLPFVRVEGPIFEYACHEGNYSLPNVLRGERYQEKLRERTDSSKR